MTLSVSCELARRSRRAATRRTPARHGVCLRAALLAPTLLVVGRAAGAVCVQLVDYAAVSQSATGERRQAAP